MHCYLPLPCHMCSKKNAKGSVGDLHVLPFIAVPLYTINEERKGKGEKHTLPVRADVSAMLTVSLALRKGCCHVRNDDNPSSPATSLSSLAEHEQRSNLHAFPS